MKIVDKYLKKLNKSDESIFPMDSLHTGKPAQIYTKDKENQKSRKKSGIEFITSEIKRKMKSSKHHLKINHKEV
jgi:hypothetical protein